MAQARSTSGPRGIERLSVNPISTIMGAIQTAVEHVAHSGDGLKHVVTQCAPPLHGLLSCQRTRCLQMDVVHTSSVVCTCDAS